MGIRKIVSTGGGNVVITPQGAGLTVVTNAIYASSGISFDAGSHTLSSYINKNSIIPAFTFTTPGDLSVAYTSQTGTFSRVGNMIFIRVSLEFTPTFTTSSGNVNITGLPAVAANDASVPMSVFSAPGVTWPAGLTMITAVVANGQTFMEVKMLGSATATARLTAADITSGTQISTFMSGVYHV